MRVSQTLKHNEIRDLHLVFTGDASTSGSTSANARIKTFFFVCASACVCAATSENEIPHNTSTWITQHKNIYHTLKSVVSVVAVKTLDSDYLAPKQLRMFA